ncbi:Gfo/Idh/MocA family oxidoreductase [Arthrobacter sp. BE255]|uniref:Gfo/Idh/MocA family protein n=1 Tax=Arthrobacter sp. BE255 TaxID=2817721 RepID=UPI0028553605|nr:Gfo/Idh/MocA family oxidoreductase [Arthrobacter sp. BE255]MDR7158371.1 putative dehydrogenase [Arthrobacter sp. BE255]
MLDNTQKVRLGVIGAGRIAQAAHLPALVKAKNLELVAISDPSPALAQGVAARYGIKGFTDTEELLRHELDAVLIATPDRFHRSLGALALNAGKHVLMEKPLASTSTEAAELADLAHEKGLKLQTGAMKRHDPGIAFARQHLPRIGRILSLTSWYRVMSDRHPIEATLFPGDLVVDPEVRRVEQQFKADRERYLLATHGAHLFDGLRFFGGPSSWVSARVGNVGEDYTWKGVADLTNSGGLISFEISTTVHGDYAEGMDVYGEHGHISIRTHFPFFKRASSVSVHIEADGTSISNHPGDTDAYKLQAEYFARAILENLPTSPDPEEGVAAVRWIEAVSESSTNDGAQVALQQKVLL